MLKANDLTFGCRYKLYACPCIVLFKKKTMNKAYFKKNIYGLDWNNSILAVNR